MGPSTGAILGIEERYGGVGDNSEIRLAIRDSDSNSIPDQSSQFLRPDSTPRHDSEILVSGLDDGGWHHLALLSRDSGTGYFYYDGAELENTSVNGGGLGFPDPNENPPWSSTRVTILIGSQWETDNVTDGSLRNEMTGAIDEVRTSLNVARSADWIDATYDNIKACDSFSLVQPEDLPSCTWGFRKLLTIDETRVSCTGDQTDFPVLVSLTDNDLKSTANGGNVENANGYDIMFRDASLNDLDFEIEEYDAVNGTLNAWVRIPTLDFDDPTAFYVYYGNPCVSTVQENPESVWSADFKGVWHGHDDLLDSTSNNNDVSSSLSTNSTGQIADGENFVDTSLQWDDFTNNASLPEYRTGLHRLCVGKPEFLERWQRASPGFEGDRYRLFVEAVIGRRDRQDQVGRGGFWADVRECSDQQQPHRFDRLAPYRR